MYREEASLLVNAHTLLSHARRATSYSVALMKKYKWIGYVDFNEKMPR